MTDKAWKACERRVAGLLNGRRVPVSGRGRGDVPDVEHARLAIEVKHRQSLPRWLTEAMAQARAAAGAGQLPIVVLHQAGQRYDAALVIFRVADFVVWSDQAQEAP